MSVKKTAEEMWRKEQDRADRLYRELWDRLKKAGVPFKEQKKIMDMIAEYGNAEISAESYCENGVDVEVN